MRLACLNTARCSGVLLDSAAAQHRIEEDTLLYERGRAFHAELIAQTVVRGSSTGMGQASADNRQIGACAGHELSDPAYHTYTCQHSTFSVWQSPSVCATCTVQDGLGIDSARALLGHTNASNWYRIARYRPQSCVDNRLPGGLIAAWQSLQIHTSRTLVSQGSLECGVRAGSWPSDS